MGAGFTATTVPSLVGWFKADAISGLNDGDTLTSWPDSTAAANHLTTVVGTPTWETGELNGLPVVRFAAASSEYVHGTGATLVAAAVGNGASFTIVAVCKPNDTAASKDICSWGQAAAAVDYQVLRISTIEKAEYHVNDGTTTNAHAAATNALSTAAFSVSSLVVTDERNPSYFLNGAANGSSVDQGTDLGSVDPDRFGIGAMLRSAPVSFFDGDIAEVLVYADPLSAADRLTVERYLGVKYGITVA